MSKFLFVVPPFFGHINPTVSVAIELEKLGHQVAWTGYKTIIEKSFPDHHPLFPIDDANIIKHFQNFTHPGGFGGGIARVTFGLMGFKFLMEEVFIPLGRDMLPGTLAAIKSFAPDVIIADQQCFAGAIAAQVCKVPWVTFCTTSASVSFGFNTMPKVKQWMLDITGRLQKEAGLPKKRYCTMSPFPSSKSLVVIFSSREFVGGHLNFPAHYHFVGPSFKSRVETTPFPWERLQDLPKVLVSFGTLNASEGKRLYEEVFLALADKPIQVIMVAPDQMLSRAPSSRPANFIVSSFIPQLAVLKKVDAVFCHGGHNTVVEALVHGLPLIIAPITDDQPVIAEQVVKAGVGLRINFRRAKAATIYSAVQAVLTDRKFKEGAVRIKASLENAGGPVQTAALIAGLVGR